MIRTIVLIAMIVFRLSFSDHALADGYAVLSLNPNAPDLSKSQVRMLFSGKLNYINGLGRIELLDWSKDSNQRRDFYYEVLNKSINHVNRNWAALAFSGKGSPPCELKTDNLSDLVAWLELHPEGLTYVPKEAIPEHAIVVYQTE